MKTRELFLTPDALSFLELLLKLDLPLGQLQAGCIDCCIVYMGHKDQRDDLKETLRKRDEQVSDYSTVIREISLIDTLM